MQQTPFQIKDIRDLWNVRIQNMKVTQTETTGQSLKKEKRKEALSNLKGNFNMQQLIYML